MAGGAGRGYCRQHFLKLRPLPHGQGEFHPNLGRPRFNSRRNAPTRARKYGWTSVLPLHMGLRLEALCPVPNDV